MKEEKKVSKKTKQKAENISSFTKKTAKKLSIEQINDVMDRATEILGKIYNLIVDTRIQEIKNHELKIQNIENDDLLRTRRNDEIIKALSVKFKPIKKVFKEAKKPKKKPEEAPAAPTPKPGKSDKPGEPVKAPATAKPEPGKPGKPAEPVKASPEVKPTEPVKAPATAKPESATTKPTEPVKAPATAKPESATPKPTESVKAPDTAKPESATPKPTESVKAPSKTAEQVKPSAPTPSATSVGSTSVGGGIAAGGIMISGVALASMKHEQGVKNVEDALNKSGNITPDVERDGYKSTSYGLFGINNINAKDKNGNFIKNSSSIASFVNSHPELKLPEPGGHNEPEQKKIFDTAWKSLGSTQPEKLLNAQLHGLKQISKMRQKKN
jgi:sporulation protein YlmC with PRC-barrel domain